MLAVVARQAKGMEIGVSFIVDPQKLTDLFDLLGMFKLPQMPQLVRSEIEQHFERIVKPVNVSEVLTGQRAVDIPDNREHGGSGDAHADPTAVRRLAGIPIPGGFGAFRPGDDLAGFLVNGRPNFLKKKTYRLSEP